MGMRGLPPEVWVLQPCTEQGPSSPRGTLVVTKLIWGLVLMVFGLRLDFVNREYLGWETNGKRK